VIAPLVVALLGLAACNSSTSGAPSSGSGSGGSAAQEAKKDKVLFDNDFEDVCSGAPQTGAAAYDKAQPGIHPVLGFAPLTTRADASRMVRMSEIPESFTRQWKDGQNTLAEIQLVVCAKRTKDTVGKKCDGYKKDGKDTGQVLTLHNATFELKLYAAKTGDQIATKTVELKQTECPMIALGDQTDEYPDAKDEVLSFIQPHVKTG
jgi:hypothetical protein